MNYTAVTGMFVAFCAGMMFMVGLMMAAGQLP